MGWGQKLERRARTRSEHRGQGPGSPVSFVSPVVKKFAWTASLYLPFFLRFMYSSTSATVLRWSSVLESTLSSASVSRNSY